MISCNTVINTTTIIAILFLHCETAICLKFIRAWGEVQIQTFLHMITPCPTIFIEGAIFSSH